jgi:hypothetical protein
MKNILSTSETIEIIRIDSAEWEVYATAEAEFDEGSSQLSVTLNVHLRNEDGQGPAPPPSVKWLPPKIVQRERVSISEAVTVAKEIFSCWVKRIRQHIPKATSGLNLEAYDS